MEVFWVLMAPSTASPAMHGGQGRRKGNEGAQRCLNFGTQRERVGLVNLGLLPCARVFWLSFLGKDFNTNMKRMIKTMRESGTFLA